MLDRDAAAEWATLIAGDGALTVQTFADRRPSSLPPQIRGGDLASLWPWICGQSDAGAGVFATVNLTAPGQRTASSVTAVRALFVDVDDPATPRPDWHLTPTLTVASGRGLHAYWSLAPWASPDPVQFRGAQRRLAAYYGSDPSVCDLPRVMRLPGTLHQKDTPRLVSILTSTGAVYSAAEVLAGLPPLRDVTAAPARPLLAPGGQIDLASIDVVALCRAAGLSPRRLAGGASTDPVWAIDCPWRSQHTDGAQGATSTVVWESGAYPAAFRCLHAHCDGRRLRDLLDKLGVQRVRQHAATRATPGAQRALERAEARLRGIR